MPRRSLTLNACTTCRKKRTKCDGKVPCSRCKTRGEKCHYEDREWQTKEHLRAELDRLHRLNQDAQAVLEAILVDNQETISVLQRLRAGETVSSIARSLPDSGSDTIQHQASGKAVGKRFDTNRQPTLTESRMPRAADGPQTTVPWDPTCPQTTRSIPDISIAPHSLVPEFLNSIPNPYSFDWDAPIESGPPMSDYASLYAPSPTASFFPSGKCDGYPSESAVNDGMWTQVTDDASFANRLIELFFAWEVVPFSMICQHVFMRDYTDGNHDFCSSALVNAIMALASRYLDADDVARTEQSFSLSERFFRESTRLLAAQGPASNLPSIQALGLLALREMCCGRAEMADALVLEALDGIAAMDPQDAGPEGRGEDYHTARAVTLSGILSLSRMICFVSDHLSPSSTFSLPDTQPLRHRLAAQPNARALQFRVGIERLKDTVQRLPESRSPGNFIFGLTELVYSSFSQLHGSESEAMNNLPHVYQKCLSCYASVSESLKDNGKPAPYCLFVHIYFHLCLLVLFRPFVHLDHSEAGAPSPRTICSEAAQAILSLTQSYSCLFTLRRTPGLMPYFVFAAGLMQLTLDSPAAVRTTDMRSGLSPSPTAASSFYSSPPSSMASPSSSASPHSTRTCVEGEGDALPGFLPQAIQQLSEMGIGHPAAAQAGCLLRDMYAAAGGTYPSLPSIGASRGVAVAPVDGFDPSVKWRRHNFSS